MRRQQKDVFSRGIMLIEMTCYEFYLLTVQE